MEHLVNNLIERLKTRRTQEMMKIEKYKEDSLKDLIFISSGKIFELDAIIQELNELMDYNMLTKTKIK
ncbi:MAG TPA: hypothetical protein DCQ26_12565 [Marinilabiliales bacterium]|jgi:hypothetical protein|nr:MAG: hypothetical protein A2W95_17300 [Bacteroidetes bacterium GWA2_40_14]OFX61764.1 MAG: hypothetical protein A2W84_13635 [Bacteroidetes bacterium GWC2_40_13]OFX76019.1 MAG: hypothetical protein A2W96_01030 [Bacteroidetes bacterium GWD2_40_43]OFX94367.1 MAG: hypothetical protein A2W97_19590 [Bacteroidetes bacterium GWE2_40_63]OFY18846.1 MAG: hypothetical protein A2W88_06360 [Bacteroidetes bacterium GWF2_40_13]OFZ24821.1 MAG: hypothetical protein A2437_15920 [Bacteroidetes bacterium RIFOXYC